MRASRNTRSDTTGAFASTSSSSGESTVAGSTSTSQKQLQPKQRSLSAAAAAVAQALDTTMRNAIESLTQDDAESALVFALVHDTEFRLATAIASVRTTDGLVCLDTGAEWSEEEGERI